MTTSAARRHVLSGTRGPAAVLAVVLALVLAVGQAAAGEARAGGLGDAPAARVAVDRPALSAAFDRPTAWSPVQVPAAPAAVVPPPSAAVVPPTTAAVTAPADLCSGDGWQQRRGLSALAGLRAGAERTGFSVAFAPARRGYLGLTHLHERRIEVFVRGCDAQSDALLRHVIAHELGHAYDTTHLTSEIRAAWQRARGIPASTDWYGCSGCTDFATPAGDFAEVYAQWARGSSDNRSQLASVPGPAGLQALATQFFGA